MHCLSETAHLCSRPQDTGFIKRCQRSTAALYETDIVQYTVGLVIFSSYISSIVGSELLPEDSTKGAHFFKVLEYVYTGIFAAELMVNMFGSWFWPFFASGWNIFDFLVVITSLIALVFPVLFTARHDYKCASLCYSASVSMQELRDAIPVSALSRECRR